MKTLATMVFGIVSTIGVVSIGMAAASVFVGAAEARNTPEPAVSDLWTTGPQPVDTARQKLQREAPLYSTYALEEQQRQIARAQPTSMKPTSIAPVEQASANVDAAERHSSAAANWCANRYRSYDPATNTYRTYGGETRACTAPREIIGNNVVGEGNAVVADSDHLSWCEQRYRSFDAATNTYRTYGGEVRTCVSPYSGSVVASN